MYTVYVNPTVNATMAVRHFSKLIDDVRMTGNSVLIRKGKIIVAEITPFYSGMPIRKFVSIIVSLPKLEKDIPSFKKDLQRIRKTNKLGKSKWG